MTCSIDDLSGISSKRLPVRRAQEFGYKSSLSVTIRAVRLATPVEPIPLLPIADCPWLSAGRDAATATGRLDMATDEERGSTTEPGDETQENLRDAAEESEGKGVGVTPGHAGQANVGDRPAAVGQTPPV